MKEGAFPLKHPNLHKFREENKSKQLSDKGFYTYSYNSLISNNTLFPSSCKESKEIYSSNYDNEKEFHPKGARERYALTDLHPRFRHKYMNQIERIQDVCKKHQTSTEVRKRINYIGIKYKTNMEARVQRNFRDYQ